jgi:hypothetical protein
MHLTANADGVLTAEFAEIDTRCGFGDVLPDPEDTSF